MTALVGQVLLLDGAPLRHVTLEIEGRRVRTRSYGSVPARAGRRGVWLEGIADRPHEREPSWPHVCVFEVAAQIVGGQTASLPYTIWMPEIADRLTD